MARKKVKLAFIPNDTMRKATYKKRKKGLVKKIDELTVLCDVDACALIYSPFEPEPEVWPSPLVVQRVLAQFRKVPEIESTKKMFNQEAFLRQRIQKTAEQVRKSQRENRETEISYVMFQSLAGRALDDLNITDLTDMGWLIEHKIREIDHQLDVSKRGESSRKRSSLLHSYEEQKPNIAAMYNLNAESSNQEQWRVEQQSNINHQIGGHVDFVDSNIHLPFENIVTTFNNNNESSKRNNNNAEVGLWSNGFFPWDK